MTDTTASPRIALFFTWDVSLDLWVQKGLFQREVAYYQKMAQSGVKITFLTWGGEEDSIHAQKLGGDIDVVPIYTLLKRPNSKALRFVLSFYAPWVLRKHVMDADVIKTNQMWGAWVAAICKILSAKKMILRSGFELYRFTLFQNHGFPRRAFTWLLSKFSYACADLIYVATDEDRHFVTRSFSVPLAKIQVRPNWIDTERFAPMGEVTVKENHILFVGRLNAQKNLPSLIRAVAEQPWTLDIAGSGEMKEELVALAAQCKANVNFLGVIANDRLPSVYNAYPVYVLVSEYEGNPKTLLEAMSCGCAVVGTDVEGIRSLIDHDKNGILCQTDDSSIRFSIERLMRDALLRRELGAAARLKILENNGLESLTALEKADCFNLVKTTPRDR